jgi:hypothetical protein
MENEKVVDTSINEVEQTTQQNAPVATSKTIEEPKSQKVEIVEKEKVFTQAQLDEIVVNRLGKERARFLKKLGVEDEAKIDEIIAKANQFEEVKSQAETLKMQQERAKKQVVLSQLDADPEFTDFLLEKIEVGEGETYEAKAKEYLEAHPKFKKESYANVDSSVSLSGQGYPDFANMTTEQYLAWRAKNKL